MWLKVWFSTLEEAEKVNWEFFEVEEDEEGNYESLSS
jgi:hypothetical protein